MLGRVFRLKLAKLMDLINKGQIFRLVNCDRYTIVWQKRRSPRTYILIWLSAMINATKIDQIISTDLPKPNTEKDL